MKTRRNRGTKLKKVVSVTMLTAMLTSLGLMGVYANDHGDTKFGFNLDYSQGDPYDYTELRWKDDDSSSYINYISGDDSFTASVVAGYDSGSRVDDDAIRRVNKNIEPGNWYYLTNYVKEDGGYNWAAIRGESNYDWFYNASGKWSPDSI